MGATRLLVANRGEIAIRILRAAAELGVAHRRGLLRGRRRRAARAAGRRGARRCAGRAPAAYLDIERIVAAAAAAGCDAVHPGYGFLTENAAFAAPLRRGGPHASSAPARRCSSCSATRRGARARRRGAACRCCAGTDGPTTLDEARAFLATRWARAARSMIKAVAGGGGRGMRVVHRRRPSSTRRSTRCRSEAAAAFGNGDLYVERSLPRARHVEVQIVGDGTGARQPPRRARVQPPAPPPEAGRDRAGARPARRAARAAARRRRCARPARCATPSLGTFEFLVDADAPGRRGLRLHRGQRRACRSSTPSPRR